MAWKPDADTYSVFATLGFNVVLAIGLMIVFEYFRYRQIDIYAPKLRKPGGKELPNPGKFPFSWILRVWYASENDILKIAGMDAYVYLRFLKMCFNIGSICSLGLVVLLPVYGTAAGSTSDEVYGINLYSMANIPENGNRLWASLIFIYLYTFVFLYFTFKEYENFVRARGLYFKGGDSSMPMQMNYSIIVENIPPAYRSKKQLKEFFELLFPGETMFSYIAISLTPLENATKLRKALLTRLETAIALYEASGRKNRPQIQLKNGVEVTAAGTESTDMIDFLYDQIQILSEEIAEFQREAHEAADDLIVEDRKSIQSSSGANQPLDAIEMIQNSLGDINITEKLSSVRDMSQSVRELSIKDVALSASKIDQKIISFITNYHEKITKRMLSATGLVTFKSRRTQAVAAQIPILSEDYPMMKVMNAPPPSDIIWDNMSASTEHTESVAFVTSLMYYTGLLFWSAVLAFISAISNLKNLETYLTFLKSLDDTSYAFLQGILPVLVMLIFLSMVPMVMATVSIYVERRKTFSVVQQEVFKWSDKSHTYFIKLILLLFSFRYFMYQIANVYLTLLAGSAFSSISDVASDPESILNYISAALPTTSVFFINFIITQLFAGVPLIFLRIFPFIYYSVIRYGAPEKFLTKRIIMEGPLVDSPVEYGTTLPDALYVLCICLLYWVISPLILLIATLYFGGNYLAWKYQYLYVIVRNYESGGQYWYGLYNYSMLGLLASSITALAYMGLKKAVTQGPLMFPLPFVVIFFWRYTEQRFKALSENVPFSTAAHYDFDPDHSNIPNAFTEDYLKQPSLVEEKIVYPCPYRIHKTPLINEDGLVNEVYLHEIPSDVDLKHELIKYLSMHHGMRSTEIFPQENNTNNNNNNNTTTSVLHSNKV